MAFLPHALDFRGIFCKYQLFSFKTLPISPKEVEEKLFWIFPDFEGSKYTFLSLMDGGRQKEFSGKGGENA